MPRAARTGRCRFVLSRRRGCRRVGARCSSAAPRDPFTLDRAAERWVERDAEEADARREDRPADRPVVRVELPQHRQRHVRRADAPRPRLSTSAAFTCSAHRSRRRPVLLNPGYGTVDPRPAVLGRLPHQPAAGAVDGAAAEHRRLRDRRRLPDLRRARVSAADGDGRDRASDDDLRLVREEARITGVEARALGVHVNFAPVADVNNNPRNPVINTRSYGEDPGAGRRAGRRLHRRRARRRHDRDDQAFSRARRHRRRQPSRPAGDHVRPRAARISSSSCRSGRASSRAPRR